VHNLVDVHFGPSRIRQYFILGGNGISSRPGSQQESIRQVSTLPDRAPLMVMRQLQNRNLMSGEKRCKN
jgi:hypothetical protein